MKHLPTRVLAVTLFASASFLPELGLSADASTTEETPDYRNWVTLSLGNSFVYGDSAAYQHRHQQTEGLFGGLEDLHFEADVADKTLLQLDARSIWGDQDNYVRLQVSKENLGYVQFGFREYITYYDIKAGYFPINGAYIQPFNDEGELLRRVIWAEAGLQLPDLPSLRLRYSHFVRDGDKGSTSWSDTTLTGAPLPNNTRNIVPSLWNIDEERDVFLADARHTVGNTDFGVGLVYENARHDNHRYAYRRPGEPQARILSHNEGYESDLFNAHGFSETRFSEDVMFTLGYSFTTLDTDLFGTRTYGAEYDAVYDPIFARRQFRDEGFFGLEGGSQLKQHLANLNLLLMPWETFRIIPSVRLEIQDQDGFSDFTETAVGAAPGRVTSEFEIRNFREREVIDVVPSLEARYDGLTNWVFYARGTWSAGQGDLREREIETEEEAEVEVIFRETDSERYTQKYAVGANWYPLRRLNFAAQYYHKTRENDYDHIADTTPNPPPSSDRYPAYILDQDFETDDVNFRVTFRPLNNLTLVSRYDYQISTIDSRMDSLSKVESAEITTHIFGQTVSWMPFNRLYLQATFNFVQDNAETPANLITGTNANLVPESENDYITGSVMTGLVLDRKTDLQLQYFYYRSDNYFNNSTLSQPFGAESEEHGITATLIHRISPRMRWNLRYGWFDNRDVTSGRHDDYSAHLVYSSLQYYF